MPAPLTCKCLWQGISGADLNKELEKFAEDMRKNAINKLSRDGKLNIQKKDGAVWFHYKEDAGESARLKGISAEEMLVLEQVREAGNTGIWTRDLKSRTNLQQAQITKVLKQLETRRLVKSIRPVSEPSKKFYISFDIEPSTEITGGAWYAGEDWDADFIDMLADICMRMITKVPLITLPIILQRIEESGLVKMQLRLEDVSSIVDTLESDFKIERVQTQTGDEDAYRPALSKLPDKTEFNDIPCGRCPVVQECHPGGAISPQSCHYYKEWLTKPPDAEF
eukprot:jgi/Astpho2/5515/Aster-02781